MNSSVNSLAPSAIEAEQEDVVVGARGLGGGGLVPAPAGRDGAITLDRVGLVLRFPGAWIIALVRALTIAARPRSARSSRYGLYR